MKYSNRYYAHYLKTTTQKEMLPYCLQREVAVIAPKHLHKDGQMQKIQRHLRVHMEDIIKKIHLFKCSKSDDPINWYYSLARYKKGLPFRNFLIPPKEKKDWAMYHWQEIISYDFCLDFDCDSFEEKIQTLPKVMHIAEILLKKVKLLEIRDSGQGFHLIVPYHSMPTSYHELSFNPYADENIYDAFKEVAIFFKLQIADEIDLSIYDSRRVVKTPGSLAIYEDQELACVVLYNSLYKDLNTFKMEVGL